MHLRLVVTALLLGLAACQPKSAPQGVSQTTSSSSSATAIAAPTADDARAFLTGIYSHYATGPSDFDPAFKDQATYFDPEMLALMQEDARLNKDEVGALDGDPICDCQDFTRITAVVTIDSVTATTATATVIATETDPGVRPEDRKPRHFTYNLVVVNGQWRIHDMTTPSIPSLRQLFITSNKEAAAYAASQSS